MSTRPFDPLSDLALSPAYRPLDLLAEQIRNPELRDLAREVLSGRVNLRGALADSRATAVLDEQVGRFSAWYNELSADERAEHERRSSSPRKASREAAASAAQGTRSRPRPDNEDERSHPQTAAMSRLVLGLVTLVAAASCARTPADSTTPRTTAEGRTSPGATEWMAHLCATATDLRTSAKDTEPLRQRLRDQLDTAADEVDAALNELAAMPAAPVDGGTRPLLSSTTN